MSNRRNIPMPDILKGDEPVDYSIKVPTEKEIASRKYWYETQREDVRWTAAELAEILDKPEMFSGALRTEFMERFKNFDLAVRKLDQDAYKYHEVMDFKSDAQALGKTDGETMNPGEMLNLHKSE